MNSFIYILLGLLVSNLLTIRYVVRHVGIKIFYYSFINNFAIIDFNPFKNEFFARNKKKFTALLLVFLDRNFVMERCKCQDAYDIGRRAF